MCEENLHVVVYKLWSFGDLGYLTFGGNEPIRFRAQYDISLIKIYSF